MNILASDEIDAVAGGVAQQAPLPDSVQALLDKVIELNSLQKLNSYRMGEAELILPSNPWGLGWDMLRSRYPIFKKRE